MIRYNLIVGLAVTSFVPIAAAELVGSAGQCGIPAPAPITLPQPAIAGSPFPIWVCPDARAYPDGFITSTLPVLDNISIIGNTIQVEVSTPEVSVFSGVLPRYWQVLATVPAPGQYHVEYYTILRANPGVGTAGEPRSLRATLLITVGAKTAASVPALTLPGLLLSIVGIGAMGLASVIRSQGMEQNSTTL